MKRLLVFIIGLCSCIFHPGCENVSSTTEQQDASAAYTLNTTNDCHEEANCDCAMCEVYLAGIRHEIPRDSFDKWKRAFYTSDDLPGAQRIERHKVDEWIAAGCKSTHIRFSFKETQTEDNADITIELADGSGHAKEEMPKGSGKWSIAFFKGIITLHETTTALEVFKLKTTDGEVSLGIRAVNGETPLYHADLSGLFPYL